MRLLCSRCCLEPGSAVLSVFVTGGDKAASEQKGRSVCEMSRAGREEPRKCLHKVQLRNQILQV